MHGPNLTTDTNIENCDGVSPPTELARIRRDRRRSSHAQSIEIVGRTDDVGARWTEPGDGAIGGMCIV